MIKQKKTRSFNFLIELLINVFFFMLASIVVVQMFVISDSKSKRAIILDKGTLLAQNIAEKYQFESIKNFDYEIDEYEVHISIVEQTDYYETICIEIHYEDECIISFDTSKEV